MSRGISACLFGPSGLQSKYDKFESQTRLTCKPFIRRKVGSRRDDGRVLLPSAKVIPTRKEQRQLLRTSPFPAISTCLETP